MKTIMWLVAVVLLAGCAGQPKKSDYQVQLEFYERAAKRAEAGRQPCFRLQAAPGQTLKIEGLAAIEADCGRAATPVRLPAPPKPAWQTVLEGLVPFARIGGQIYGARENRRLWQGVVSSVAGMERADNSTHITVGGNYGDSDNSLSYGDGAVLGDGNTVGDGNTLGDGNAGGDLYGDGVVQGDGNAGGDLYGDNANNSGRIDSPDTIDNSDNSDNSQVDNSVDNSGNPPPAP